MIDLHLTVKNVRKVQDVGPGDDENATTWTYTLEAPLGSKITLRSGEKPPLVSGDGVRVRIDGANQTSLEDHADAPVAKRGPKPKRARGDGHA